MRILPGELKPQVKVLFRDRKDLDVDLAARGMADAIVGRAIGKFAFSTRTLYLVLDNFAKLAEELKMERIRKPEFVHAIVIPELAHALDEESYGLAALIAACKAPEEIEVVGARIEGHAQFVTEAVLKADGDKDLFRDVDRAITAPPTTGEGEKFFAELQNHAARFAYGKGHAFFVGLSKSGRPTFVDDVFKSPPKRKSVILKPETFYQPAAGRRAAADLTPFFEDMTRTDTPEDWRGQVVKMDETHFRAAFGDFVPTAALDKACEGFLGATLHVRASGDGSAMVAVGVVECVNT